MFDIFYVLFLFSIFLCWGSFLNVVAYRITYDKPFFTKRSVCPFCGKIVFWYDNLPILSWVLLRGRCRFCRASISILYPCIELLSGILFTSLVLFFPLASYLLFFSALIIAIRTDLEAMVIPQVFSIWLAPVGVLLSLFGFTRVSFWESLLGALVGYGVLWSIAALFKYFTKRDGLGVGDMELLAMIGSFLGPIGVWFSVFIGSVSGLVIGGGYLLLTKKGRNTRIPFGPFLALGATIYFFFESFLFRVFF
ncbi:prepilin peptidase [Candidatus Dependentiae bacterium]|nr:prepilin peptidase [Candidatus Dependentiae bacterium]